LLSLRFPLTITALLVGCEHAVATCESVYERATRNFLFTEDSHSELFALFDKVCERTGDLKTETTDTEADVVIKAVPIKFQGAHASSRDRVRNFCREYRSTRMSDKLSRVRTSDVVVEALENFNICMAVDADFDINVEHAFVDPGAIIFDFKFRGVNTRLSVSDVAHSKNIQCTSTNIKRDGDDDGRVTFGPEQDNIIAESSFNIVCRRVGEEDGAGGTQYQPAFVGIATDLGTYKVSMPADEIYSAELASDARAQISSLIASNTAISETLRKAESENTTLEQHVGSLQTRLDQSRVEVKHFTLGDPGGPGIGYGCGIAATTVIAQLCEGAKQTTAPVQTGIRAGGPGGCGVASYVVGCMWQ
jgi:hypothetical protein